MLMKADMSHVVQQPLLNKAMPVCSSASKYNMQICGVKGHLVQFSYLLILPPFCLASTFEPPHKKKQQQRNGMCAQRRLRSAWASTRSDQSLRRPHEESFGR